MLIPAYLVSRVLLVEPFLQRRKIIEHGGRIHLASSADGFHFEGYRPLPAVSACDPALAAFGGRLFLAWVGLDGRWLDRSYARWSELRYRLSVP